MGFGAVLVRFGWNGGDVVPFANYMDRDERLMPGTVDRASTLNPLGLLRGANCGT